MSTYRTRLLVASLLAGLLLPGTDAAQKITSVGGITEYRLDNGLQVLLFPDESRPTVTVNITYLVGSRHEGYGESGMAHLLEHLMFKGTPDHPQIWKELQDRGAVFNGSTSYDRTNYFETLPAGDENLEFALKLEADRMVNSFISARDLESEMTVVRNEFEMGENNPIGVLSERIMSAAYLWHNYGKAVIGSREDIERVPIERLQAFYRRYYQPDNAVLVVAGKFDETKALKLIEDTFGRIPRPQRQLDRTYTVEPVQDGEREVVLRRVGDIQAIGVVYHICAAAHPDAAPLQVLAHILAAEQTGRLYRALIETGLATSVDAQAAPLREPGVLEILVQARLDQPLEPVRSALLDVLDNLGSQEFTEEEVDRARKVFARNFDLLMRDSTRLALRLSESAAQGDWRLMFLHRDRLEKVTPADVQRVAAHYLKPSNRTIGVFIPTRQPDRTTIPPTPDLAELLKDYRDTQEVARGEAFEATYANIEARTLRRNLPVGMKLALLPKQTRGDRVNAVLLFHYGSEKDLTGRETAASLLGPMLLRGTARHTRREIQDLLAELKAQMRIAEPGGMGRRFLRLPGSGPGALEVTIETTRDNLPAVLELAAEILREPAFPPEEFQTLQREVLAETEEQMSEPMLLAANALLRRLYPYPQGDVRYVPTPEEQVARIKAVTRDDIASLHRELLGASHCEAAFVGDFDPDEVTSLLDRLFGDWKSPRPFARIESRYQPVAPETLVISTPDKANAMVLLGMPLEVRDDEPDYPGLLIANYVLGSSPNSRLFNRIRQKEGLAYGCGSTALAGSLDRVGTFIAFSLCAPQNALRAITCAQEEIRRMLTEGLPQQELDDARNGYRRQIEVNLGNDGNVAGMLARNLFFDRTMKFYEEQLARIEALTPEAVQNALARYVRPEQLVIVRAGDFGSSPPSEE
jgi:zinc protease